MSFTVVIPSKDVSNLNPCLASLYLNEPSASVIVVDDGLTFRPDGPTYVDGEIPFVFARNCNIGIRKAPSEDNIVLLNDDALLITPNGFSRLEEFGIPEWGAIVPATNVTGNAHQWPQNRTLEGWREAGAVPYLCVWLNRKMLNEVGILDERYSGCYGSEDRDHLESMHRKGWKSGIFYDVFVDHESLKSTFRGNPRTPGDCEAGRRIFREKWGFEQ